MFFVLSLLQQYLENRKKYIEAQKTKLNPYPHKFFVSISILEYIKKYNGLSNGEHKEDTTESLAGMKTLALF